MNDLIELLGANGKMISVSASSIALIDDAEINQCTIVMKEKNPDGVVITLIINDLDSLIMIKIGQIDKK